AGITIGSSIAITASGFVVTSTVKLGVEVSYSYEWGEKLTTTITRSISADYDVAPYSIETISILAERYVIDVPYTADLITVYSNGAETSESISGTYREASASRITTNYYR
ncbi:hypothetical protein, partial [Salmonella sp. s55004]|uniref:hypothetical protein n=1 Tax=Salmonella sp. s55004 TaxID=3159675 RepID=UPI003980FC03